MDTLTSQQVLDKIRDAFGRLAPVSNGAATAVDDLVALYDETVVFQDPFVRIEGREAFAELNRRLMRRARVLRVRLGGSAASGDDLFLTWEMDYAFKRGPVLTVQVVSHLRLAGGLVVSHRDYWDPVSSTLGRVPGVGRAYRALTSKLA